jgi:tripartite-type tricarboxylate transporter receptor subunit TctC
MRRAFGRALLGLAAALAGPAAFAQAYPEHSIKLIVGIGACSSTDAISRLIARKLGERFAQTVVVDNRPGAGGTLGAEAGAKAPPDGYTLLSATSSIPIFRHTYTLRFDPEKDLIPVGGVAKGAMVLIVRGDDRAPTIADLIARAKAKPQSVSYGSAGVGSNAHLASEVFAQIAGVEFLHVPYKSSVAGMTDLLGGQVDFIFDALATVQPFIKSKAAKGLAVTTTERSSFLPELPTMSEAGVREFSHPVWYAVFAPAGTPSQVVGKLSREIRDIVAQPSFREELAKFGVEPFPVTSEALALQIRDESDAWSRKLKSMKLQAP